MQQGLERVKDYLKDCAGCGLCSGLGPITPYREGDVVPEEASPSPKCPIKERFKFTAYSARGLLWLCAAVQHHGFQLTEDLANVVYTCTTCGLCDELCFVRKMDAFKALREEIVEHGAGPLRASKTVDENITRVNNPLGEKLEDRIRWAADLDLPQRGETVYFPGCYAAYRYPQVARATVRILRAAGYDVAYLAEKEVCCGTHFIWDGQYKMARAWAARLSSTLEKAGAKRVIVSCADCYRSLKIDHVNLLGKEPFKVIHTSELLASVISEGKLKFQKESPQQVTYHDPCRLGRLGGGIYEPPRDILRAIPGLEFAEMPRKRRWAWCCGGGGLVVLNAFPEFARWTAAQRLAEAKKTAPTLVTACPHCLTSFERAAGAENSSLNIHDLNALVAEAMGIEA
jgi:Fe-S oxidoreductase